MQWNGTVCDAMPCNANGTASAIATTHANANTYDDNNSNKKYTMSSFNDLSFQYYFYIEAEDIPGVMASITSIFAKKNIGIESIVQKENLDKNLVPIVLISDAFIEKEHSDLLAQVLELESVNKIRSIRIEPN